MTQASMETASFGPQGFPLISHMMGLCGVYQWHALMGAKVQTGEVQNTNLPIKLREWGSNLALANWDAIPFELRTNLQ